jgi:outer membrane lipoprotein SlyB
MINFKRIGASLAIVGILVGCAETAGGGFANPISDLQTVSATASPEQRALSNQQRDYAKARLQSAGLGALMGTIGCWGGGCSNREIAERALAGAVAGYLVGGYLTNRNANFQGTQETLQKDIQVARQDNQRLQNSVAAANNVVKFQREQIRTLNAGLRQGSTSVDQYRADVALMQQDVATTRKIREDAIENVKGLDNSIQRHRAAGLPTSGLTQQRTAQEQRISELRREEQRMLSNIASAPAEVRA